MKVNRRDAMAIAAAGTVGAMFPVAEPEMYPEPELLPAFKMRASDVQKGTMRMLWASFHDEYDNTMSEYSDGTVDYHFCDGRKVLGAQKSDMEYYKKWWRDHG